MPTTRRESGPSTTGKRSRPDALKRIVDLYLTNSRTLIGTLREAVIRHDAPGVVLAAHSLKSSSANVGNLESAWAQLELLVEKHERVVLALYAQTAAA
jgi:HPt (histidine-containing phosphotransfer) domain-containing protein